MSRGLSGRQREIYGLIERRSRQGQATTSLDVIERLFPKRAGDKSFRKSIWRSLLSLESRGWIQLYSLAPGRRERGAGGAIRYITPNFQEVSDERR